MTAREVLDRVVDPELPVLTIADLGVLREVTETAGGVEVTITPTYSGCPALDTIRADIEQALHAAGFARVTVRTQLAPAWSSADLTPAGRRALAESGIAPPGDRPVGPVPVLITPRCPNCGSPDTRLVSRFSSTACKAMHRCTTCQEPFESFKAH